MRKRNTIRIRSLTLQQVFELLLGPKPAVSHFRDDEERREAWAAHKDELLRNQPPGTRPWAWWQERGERRPEGREQTLLLLDMGEIGDDEMRRLEKSWRLYDATARAKSEHQTRPGRLKQEVYREERRRYGIPDWWEAD